MKRYLFTPLFKQYGSFQGRACRKEYFSIVVFLFGTAYGLSALVGLLLPEEIVLVIAPKLPLVFSLVFGIPITSAGVRRLHDTNRSGWWFWIQVIPFIGFLWYVVLMFLKGSPSTNRFGPKTVYFDSDEEDSDESFEEIKDMNQPPPQKPFNPYESWQKKSS